VVDRCEDALKRGEHANLILEVEASFARAPFWLDVHRYTAMALDALGPTHAQARRTVITELASFLARIAGVLDLKFADGTPFADDQTRLWIESEVRPPVQERHAVTPVASTDNGAQLPPWVQVAQEAKQLAAQGKVLEGVALLQTGQQQVASQRERFLWRLQQARFCAEAGLLEVAVPQLEFLGDQAERFALEEWEPWLSLEVVQLLLQCYYRLKQKTTSPPAELVEKAQRLHTRLCRLDVTAALALDGKT
jgi:type VI secretion system protein VasJ